MKNLAIAIFVLLVSASTAYSQGKTAVKAGFGYVQSGDGDIPGSLGLVGIQKKVTPWIGYDILASGTLMERTRDYGQGNTVREVSNGLSLEGNVNLFVNFWRLTFYPSIGPVIRYAHERHPQSLGIWYDASGRITQFESNITDEYQLQYGYTIGLNLDGRISEKFSLGVRGSVQDYHSGQMLAFIGFTLKKSGLEW